MKMKLILAAAILAMATTAYSAILPGNLVSNADMETDAGAGAPVDWYTGGGTWDSTESVSPSHSLKIDDQNTGSSYDWRSLDQQIPAGTTQLDLQWNWKYVSVNGELAVTIRFFEGPGNFNFKGEENYWSGQGSTSGWETRNETKEVPAGAHYFDIVVRTLSGGGIGGTGATGTVWVDDLSVAPVPVAYGDSLVLNGDFEAGLADWFYGGGVTAVSDNGDLEAGVSCAEIASTDLRSPAIAVDPNSAYMFIFEYKGGTSKAWVRFWTDVDGSGNATGTWLGENYYENGAQAGWTPVTGDIATPLGANYVDIRMENSGDPVRVDNILFAKKYAADYKVDFNIVTNGDAEADFLGWYHSTNVTINSTDNTTPDGTKSFELDNTSDVWLHADLRSETISIEPNEPMLLRFSYKTLPGFNMIQESGLRAQARSFKDAAATQWTGESVWHLPVTDGEWVQKEYEFNTYGDPTGTYIDLLFIMNDAGGLSDGVVRFDDIQLYSTRCPQVPGPELFENGGFETGDLDQWHTANNVGVVGSPVASGSYALECTTAGASEIVHNSVAVAPGDTLFMDIDFMAPSGATVIVAYAKIRFYTEANAFISEVAVDLVSAPDIWTTVSREALAPAGAGSADVYIYTLCFNSSLYVDNVSLKMGVSDCGGTLEYGMADLQTMVSQWLTDDFQALLPDNSLDDFESYANQAALDVKWAETSGSYASGGSQTITLITDPGQTHSGDRALRWTYDNSGGGRVWTEFHTIFSSAVNFSQYNEFRVWMNRHSGNSTEELFYVKFYNSTIAESNILAEAQIPASQGSTATPTGWTEWVIDLDDLIYQRGASSKDDLNAVVGYFFGVVGDTTTQGLGTGTIDFDDIVLVNTTPNCGSNQPSMDLNDSCLVNLEDFAVLAEFWVGE